MFIIENDEDCLNIFQKYIQYISGPIYIRIEDIVYLKRIWHTHSLPTHVAFITLSLITHFFVACDELKNICKYSFNGHEYLINFMNESFEILSISFLFKFCSLMVVCSKYDLFLWKELLILTLLVLLSVKLRLQHQTLTYEN